MSQNKHTPGPWDSDMFPDTEGYKIRSAGRVIAIVKSRDSDLAMQPQMNKALIAAAPELLEALELLIAETDPLRLNAGEPWCRVRAAIAKARGEQP